jgi:membrane-associated protease RseP (regulator of RpoE activity)
VTSVTGPAAAAGMTVGDFVMAWHAEGSEAVASADCAGLNEAMQTAGPGKTVTMTLWKPDAGGVTVERQVRVPHPRIMGADINKNDAGQFRIDRVLPHSPAAKAGLKVGDFVVSIEGVTVVDIDHAIRLIRNGPEVQRVVVLRDGKGVTVSVRTAPLTSVITREIAGLGLLVTWVYAPGASAEPESELRAGDVLLDYSTSRAFTAALQAQGAGMTVRIRREGIPRLVNARLEAIPDARYRVGTAIYARGAAPAAPASAPEPAAVAAPGALPDPARGCVKDIECKGDRICVKGECVDPKPR